MAAGSQLGADAFQFSFRSDAQQDGPFESSYANNS